MIDVEISKTALISNGKSRFFSERTAGEKLFILVGDDARFGLGLSPGTPPPHFLRFPTREQRYTVHL